MSRGAVNHAEAPMRKRIAKGGAWVLLNRVLVAVTQLVTLGLLARMMSPEDMGLYFIIANFVVVGGVFAQLGLPQIVVKRTAESIEDGDREQIVSVIQTCFIVGCLSAVLCLVLLSMGLGDWFALTLFDAPVFAQLMPLVAVWLVIQAIQRIVGEAFRGLHDMRMAAIFGGMFSGVLSTLIFIVMGASAGASTLNQVVIVFLVSISLSFVGALFLLHKRIGLFSKFNPSAWRPVMLLALPIFFASLGNIILMRADIWLLGMFVDDADVALYGAAARLVGLFNTPLLIATAVLSPTIAQLNKRGDLPKLQQVVQLVPSLIAVPALLCIAIFVFWGDALLSLIYGGDFYAGSQTVLTILAIGQVISLLAGVSIQILFMTESQKQVMTVTLLATATAIVLSVLLVGSYGIEGVATAFAASTALQALACVLLCRIKLGINSFFSIRSLFAIKSTLQTMRQEKRRRREQAMP